MYTDRENDTQTVIIIIIIIVSFVSTYKDDQQILQF